MSQRASISVPKGSGNKYPVSCPKYKFLLLGFYRSQESQGIAELGPPGSRADHPNFPRRCLEVCVSPNSCLCIQGQQHSFLQIPLYTQISTIRCACSKSYLHPHILLTFLPMTSGKHPGIVPATQRSDHLPTQNSQSSPRCNVLLNLHSLYVDEDVDIFLRHSLFSLIYMPDEGMGLPSLVCHRSLLVD